MGRRGRGGGSVRGPLREALVKRRRFQSRSRSSRFSRHLFLDPARKQGRRSPRIVGPPPRPGDLATAGRPLASLPDVTAIKRRCSIVGAPRRGPPARGLISTATGQPGTKTVAASSTVPIQLGPSRKQAKTNAKGPGQPARTPDCVFPTRATLEGGPRCRAWVGAETRDTGVAFDRYARRNDPRSGLFVGGYGAVPGSFSGQNATGLISGERRRTMGHERRHAAAGRSPHP